MKERKDKITNIWNKKEDINTDLKDMKIIREYCKQLCKFET